MNQVLVDDKWPFRQTRIGSALGRLKVTGFCIWSLVRGYLVAFMFVLVLLSGKSTINVRTLNGRTRYPGI